MRDAASLPLLLVGVFMLVSVGTKTDELTPEDRLFAGISGDFRETTFGVHGGAGVYPVRIRYYDNPRYDGPPVILVHGMGTSDAYFWRVRGEVEVFAGFIFSETRDIAAVGHAQGLVDLGYDVVTYTYPDSRNRPLEYQAYDLARVVKWTKERFICPQVILVGHSTGGLICRYYLESGQPGRKNYQFPYKEKQDYEWNRFFNISDFEMRRLRYRYDVAALVLIATPNYGGLKKGGRDYGSPALYEMTEESDFLAWLEEGRRNAGAEKYKRPPVYVLVGKAYENYMGEGPLDFGDGIVTVPSAVGPYEEADGAEVYYFNLDHFELAMDGEVLARLYTVLQRSGEEGPS
ncbi:MAG: alpha/beta fold hydrolase [Candidatus Coatesbacteria bacterium]|nr:MAG: alpha/beta fold hydrolase [Candidatus Coatesbacteria bacterium]